MNRVTFTVLGYILLVVGFLSLILGLIGLNLRPLTFVDQWFGPMGSLFVKLLLVIVGLIMFYMSRVPLDDE